MSAGRSSEQRFARRLQGDDTGITLVELVVYVVLTGIVSTVVAVLFMTLVNSNVDVGARDKATTEAQAVSMSLSTHIRNAAQVIAVTSGTTVGLRARVASASAPGGWTCYSWAVVPAAVVGGTATYELRINNYASWAGGGAPPSLGAGGVAAERVVAIAASPTPLPFFAASASRATWNIGVASSSSTAVVAEISGGATPQSVGSARNCW